MKYVYCVWFAVGAYEGEDVLCGIFESLIEAEVFVGGSGEDIGDYYISKVEMGKALNFFGTKGEMIA